jgi:hypothetical protein
MNSAPKYIRAYPSILNSGYERMESSNSIKDFVDAVTTVRIDVKSVPTGEFCDYEACTMQPQTKLIYQIDDLYHEQQYQRLVQLLGKLKEELLFERQERDQLLYLRHKFAQLKDTPSFWENEGEKRRRDQLNKTVWTRWHSINSVRGVFCHFQFPGLCDENNLIYAEGPAHDTTEYVEFYHSLNHLVYLRKRFAWMAFNEVSAKLGLELAEDPQLEIKRLIANIEAEKAEWRAKDEAAIPIVEANVPADTNELTSIALLAGEDLGTLDEAEEDLYGPCIAPLTLAQVDLIADKVDLISDVTTKQYCRGDRGKYFLVAFHQALKENKLVEGTVEELNAFFGNRYNVSVRVKDWAGKRGTKNFVRDIKNNLPSVPSAS